MQDHSADRSLLAAVAQYFDLMFDSDITRFDQVFAASAQLHGLRDGTLRVLPTAEYKQVLATTPSPRQKQALRTATTQW